MKFTPLFPTGKRLLSSINNVFDMARIESGKMKADENYERVGEVVDEIINTVSSEAEERGILPFCGEENGKLTGILGTVLDTVQEKYEITIKAVHCFTGVQMNEKLQSGEIDIAGSIIQDFYTQEQFQVVLTDAIFAITPVQNYNTREVLQCHLR